MIDVKNADRELQLYVRPQTFPVAIRMLRPGEAIPERQAPLQPPGSATKPIMPLLARRSQYWLTQWITDADKPAMTSAQSAKNVHI